MSRSEFTANQNLRITADNKSAEQWASEWQKRYVIYLRICETTATTPKGYTEFKHGQETLGFTVLN